MKSVNSKMEFNWSEIEAKIGEVLPLCVKKILCFCAYDSFNTLRELNAQKICEIEKCVVDCGEKLVSELDCCHSNTYKNLKSFKLLPGHRALLLDLPNHIPTHSNASSSRNIDRENSENHNSLSTMLVELIKSAEKNALKSKHHSEYSDIVRYFFTYIYLMSGRSCYDTLQRNLPIPSIKTICKLIVFV